MNQIYSIPPRFKVGDEVIYIAKDNVHWRAVIDSIEPNTKRIFDITVKGNGASLKLQGVFLVVSPDHRHCITPMLPLRGDCRGQKINRD